MTKVSELEGSVLDEMIREIVGEKNCPVFFNPSMQWSDCGPLIEEYKVALWHYADGGIGPYHAYVAPKAEHFNEKTDERRFSKGPTPLIAACRCIVASKYGEEVDA